MFSRMVWYGNNNNKIKFYLEIFGILRHVPYFQVYTAGLFWPFQIDRNLSDQLSFHVSSETNFPWDYCIIVKSICYLLLALVKRGQEKVASFNV